ncbi:MAG: sodium:proton antiporter [Candidatus Omnitrophica bacterium]|nr:sodium:proton antiporter [Candidatus Omnitrophota bacterium]
MLAELVWVIPFAALLISIAALPLLQKHFWEKNYPLVCLSLALLVAARYVFFLRNALPLVHTAGEYLSFIALIGSLYVVAGGIHINVKGEATPVANCVFLLIGAILSNFLGTTGASMVMIRPWLRMNRYRLTAYHVVFFIFLVSNIGGGLTPIGDPPLFLGYLQGVPFFWVLENAWPVWSLTVGLVLAVFYFFDSQNFKRAPGAVRQKETGRAEEWRFLGGHNVFFLFMIIGSVFLNRPVFLRESIMIAAAVLSYRTTRREVHESNDFSFGPIREVAILFAGIFTTMIPALEWLERHAQAIGIHSPAQFYWGSGVLSSVLDNAPTYLNFLSAAGGLFAAGAPSPVQTLLADHSNTILAISVGSVFFGAMTYIGNGPNLLVKSIADRSHGKTPGFFHYILGYSLPVLLPIFALVGFLFFR